MSQRDIVVIGASAGGVTTLQELVAGLPEDLPAAIFVVQHISAASHSILPKLLSRAGPLPASHPDDREPIRHGRIYVAPPDHHLLVARTELRVVRGAHEHRTRPAVDPLFRSAAVSHGPRVIGVVLTGTLNDGSAGLKAIKRCNGLAVVQDPADALFPDMPRNALRHAEVDHCVPVSVMAELLSDLIRQPLPLLPEAAPPELALEVSLVEQDRSMSTTEIAVGQPSGLGCPDCGGSLQEMMEDELLRFRCRVGHAYTAESLLAAQSQAVEQAIWVALRTHSERGDLFARLAENARRRNHPHSAEIWDKARRDAEVHVATLRNLLSALTAAQRDQQLGAKE